jgi:hypothetical protein
MAGASQFVFGSGLLYGTRTDTANNTPRLFGTMQDVSIDFDGDIKELFGQFTFPVDVARGKTKIAGKAKFATVSGEIYNDLFFGQTLNTGQEAFAYNEAATLPAVITGTTNGTTAAGNATLHFASTPAGISIGSLIQDTTSPSVIPAGAYVISQTGTTVVMSANATGGGVGGTDGISFSPAYQVANFADTPLIDLGVTQQVTGIPWTEDAAILHGTASGNYNFIPSLGAYSFSDADEGKSFFFTYIYSKVTGTTIVVNNPFMGTTPRFQAVFAETFEEQQVVFTLLNCVASKLMFATKIDDYTIPEMDFSAFANAAGSVGTLSFAN